MDTSKAFCALVFIVTMKVFALALDDNMVRFPYIVHVDRSMKPHGFSIHDHWYASMIAEAYVGSPSVTPPPILYTYNTVVHGFAAMLSSAEAKSLEKAKGCLGVFPDSLNQLHTTRTPDFLGLSSTGGPWAKSHYGRDVIVGLLDSGVWPESKSFGSQGMKSVPARWKGKCEGGQGFNSSHCNNKLIGVRYFLKGYESATGRIRPGEDYRSARDANGHGTHTASTAAGSTVPGANLLGFARGTARGMATAARVAAYKVCWPQGCTDSDIIAGMEAALADGVDVLSLSIGGSGIRPYYLDPIAIGALEAAQRGVFVSCSAGNSGPTPSDIANTAPWITTVGATTIDRAFPAPVVLGDGGATFPGSSLYKRTANKQHPLVYGNGTASLCLPGSLDPGAVRGKIVVCDRGGNGRVEKGLVVRGAGGAGMIIANQESNGDELTTDCHLLPATIVGYGAGERMKAYINGTKSPTGSIRLLGSTVVGVRVLAPVVAGFSSRGPNPAVPEILKPDLVAPGVNILAAWTKHTAPSESEADKRRVDFNVVSGTSMSCPHVAGIAALIRAAHPSWSPAAIKSSLMTTSALVDNTRNSILDSVTKRAASPFVVGAGHVNPKAAMDPGLIYDLGTQEYVNFLCALNYTEKEIRILTKKQSVCPRSPSRPGDLNYPSFSVIFKRRSSVYVTKRTVTNVGEAPSVYTVAIESPANVKIRVEPKTLVFKEQNQKASFTVRFKSRIASTRKTEGHQEFGHLSWKCITGGMHVVRSPIAMAWTAEE